MADDRDVAAAYRAPAADADYGSPRTAAPGEAAFYVVSIPKLTILFVATLGVYGAYWFYRHYKIRKLRDRDGRTNAGIDLGSVLACLIGALFWVLVVLSMTLEPVPG